MSWKLPTKTEWMIEQMNHEPSRLYAEDMYNLAKKFPFGSALEVGCMWGLSTLALLLGSKGKLVSVDKSSYTHAEEEVEKNGLKNRWTFLNLDSHVYWEKIDEKFDLVYVDGDHRYDQAHEDIHEGWKRVKEGGILAVDDVIHKNNRADSVDPYGVSLAAWQHFYNNKVTDLGFCGRILWFKK